MTAMRFVFLLLLVTWVSNGSASAQQREAEMLALTGANVVDVANGTVSPDQTVLVMGNRIVATGSLEFPSDAQVVDVAGRYVIPGLWDMHVHVLWDDIDPSELLVAHGITGARDTWGALSEVERRSHPMTGDTLAPRVVMAGAILDGAPSTLPGTVSVTTPAQARAALDSLADGGAPFVKVYDSITPDVYAAIVAQARERGIPVVGHVPWRVRAAEVSDAGQRSIEHAFGVLPECSSNEEAILASRTEALASLANQDMPGALQRFIAAMRLVAAPDDEACRRLAGHLVRNQTWVVPTLVALRGSWLRDDPAFRDDPRLAYIPAGMRGQWLPENGFISRFFSPADWEAGHAMYARAVEIVRRLHEWDVPILAGTDAGVAYTFFGSGLHDELELLVEAGLSPTEALQAATVNPAVFLERTDDFGAVEPGKIADLVILNGNPLEDIANVREIEGVVLDGTWLPRARLDAILADTVDRFEASHE